MRSINQTFAGMLSHPRFVYLAAALGALFTLPSLMNGWQVDDYYHRLILKGLHPVHNSPMSLFEFFKQGDGGLDEYIQMGIVPWWTWEGIQIAFFRPLAVFAHWLDYQLWPDSAPLQHAHNIAWHFALCLAAGLAYRRIFVSGWIIGLAALMFALDENHGFPAGWIANRNALMAACFGLAALAAHDRWRRDNWAPGALIAPALFAMSLLSAEFGVGALAYLMAHTLTLDPAPWRRRWIALAPHAAVFIAWQLAYRSMGYGAYGSGFYIDPGREPLEFMLALTERLPILLQTQWVGLPAGITIFLPPWLYSAFVAVSVVATLIILASLGPLMRSDRVARFFTIGMLLACVPVSAVFPTERVLLLVGFGAFGLIAQLIHALVSDAHWPSQNTWLRHTARLWVYFLIFAHLIAGPLILPFASMSPQIMEPLVNQPALSVPDTPDVPREEWIILDAPIAMMTFYTPVIRAEAGMKVPLRVRPIASTSGNMTLTRIDEHTLRIEVEGGFLASPLDRLLRDDKHPIPLGDPIDSGGMTVTVVKRLPDGRPAIADFSFSKPLEHPALRFFKWVNGTLVDIKPPGNSKPLVIGQ